MKITTVIEMGGHKGMNYCLIILKIELWLESCSIAEVKERILVVWALTISDKSKMMLRFLTVPNGLIITLLMSRHV